MSTANSDAAPFDEWTSCWNPTTPTEPGALAGWQLRKAWEITEQLADANPFYKPRISAPATRDAASFRRLQVTRKSDVVADCEAHPPYGSRTVAPSNSIRHMVETSGTSGRGREVYALDEADERAVVEAEVVGFWWAGVRPGTTVLLTLPVGVTAAGIWYYSALRRLGANVISAGAYSTDRKAELLRRYRAEVVIGTPTYLERLASVCEEHGMPPSTLGVRSLVVAGEPYSLAWARVLQARWDATLYEQYGCTERMMGWACPGGVVKNGELGALHVPAELAYWEVLDPVSGEPVEDGEWGEMIATPLRAAASPLLRFATSDRVQLVAAGSCPCGRPLAGIRAGGVHRYDDMLKVRGVNVWPKALDEAIFGVGGVHDYRGTVMSDAAGRELVELRVEIANVDDVDAVAKQISQRVRKELGLSVAVKSLRPGHLAAETPEGFVKVSRWRDVRRAEIPPAQAPRAVDNPTRTEKES